METERIVLMRPGALGDTLLTFPALALLRRARRLARVTFIARRDVLPLVRATGLADAVYPYDLPAWSAIFAPRGVSLGADPLARDVFSGADVVAWLGEVGDNGGSVATNLRALGARRVVVAPGRPVPGDATHMALQLARVFTSLGVSVPDAIAPLRALVPPVRPAAEDASRIADLWDALGLSATDRVVAVHPGSGGAAKRWPSASFAALADAIRSWGARPLLVEGPQDEAVCAAVQSASTSALPVACDLGLGALMALLSRCAGYVGNDSGVTHLAGLLGAPALALFGPTDPAVWGPLGPHVRTLRAPNAAMERLEDGVVAAALQDLLGSRPWRHRFI